MSMQKKLLKQTVAVCKADVSAQIDILKEDHNNTVKADR